MSDLCCTTCGAALRSRNAAEQRDFDARLLDAAARLRAYAGVTYSTSVELAPWIVDAYERGRREALMEAELARAAAVARGGLRMDTVRGDADREAFARFRALHPLGIHAWADWHIAEDAWEAALAHARPSVARGAENRGAIQGFALPPGPAAPATVPPDAAEIDGDGGACTVCGRGVFYGERHRACGAAVLAAEEEAVAEALAKVATFPPEYAAGLEARLWATYEGERYCRGCHLLERLIAVKGGHHAQWDGPCWVGELMAVLRDGPPRERGSDGD